MIFLDTCALLYNAFEKKRLSPTSVQKIEESDGFLISSISIWEIGIKIKKGKLDIPISLEELISKLNQVHNFQILSIDENTWVNSLNLDWDHRDPADRVIVASADARQMELITSDTIILDFYDRAVW
nr:type II toxin-antitoxin system VapC family toxin [uncultured Desulfobacter sp.]